MENNTVLQPWVTKLTMMQQSVLISSIRAPDKATARRTLRAFNTARLVLDIEEVATGVVVNWNDFECCGSWEE